MVLTVVKRLDATHRHDGHDDIDGTSSNDGELDGGLGQTGVTVDTCRVEEDLSTDNIPKQSCIADFDPLIFSVEQNLVGIDSLVVPVKLSLIRNTHDTP